VIDIEARREELLQQISVFKRLTAAVDLRDKWHRRFASMLKPRHVISFLLGAATMLLLIMLPFVATGHTVASRKEMTLLALVERVVPDAAGYDAAHARVALSTAARTILFIDQAITGRKADPADLFWHVSVFGRPAPQVSPGREAILLALVDRIAAQPPENHADLIDRLVMTWGLSEDAKLWSLFQKLGGLDPKSRQILMEADAKALLDIVRWLEERVARERTVTSIRSMAEAHRLELADQAKGLQESTRAMMLQLENTRDRKMACAPYVRAFEACVIPRNR
jgi:hypothetical protein